MTAKRESQLPDWLMVVLTLVIAVVTAIQVWLLFESGKQTDALVAAAEKQAKAATDFSGTAGAIKAEFHNAAENSIKEAKRASQEAAANATKSLENTQAVFRDEQRAWLGSTAATLLTPPRATKPFEVNHKIQTEVKVLNTGKTPAINVRICSAVELTEHGWGLMLPDFDCRRWPTYPYPPILPGDSFRLPINTEQELFPKEPEMYEQGAIQFAAEGIVSYDDVFRRHHWVRFCWRYNNQTKDLFSCSNNNDMDLTPNQPSPAGGGSEGR